MEATDIVDELIINDDKVSLLKKHRNHIHNAFEVEVKLGFVSDTDSNGSQRWVEVRGQEENRKTAKEYIKAMCNPQEILSMTYPEGMHDILSDSAVHQKLEKQSRAAILFENNKITICGTDNLSVTLAMSSIEELIHRYLKEATPIGELASPNSRVANTRLDSELRRLSSEDQSLDWGEGNVRMSSSAVKRAVLSLFADETNNDKDVVIGTKKASKISPVRSAKGPKAITSSIPVLPSSAATSSTNSPIKGSPGRGSTFLREVALGRGYTEKEIQHVFSVKGTNIKSSELMKALMENQKGTNSSSNIKTLKTPERVTVQASTSEGNRSSPADGTPHLQDYFQRLGQDAEAEKNCNLDELKKLNEQRQQLLREAYLKRGQAVANSVEAMVISDEGSSSGGEDVQYVSYHPPAAQNRLKNGSHAKGTSIDALDDFSLPPEVGKNNSPKRHQVPPKKNPKKKNSPNRKENSRDINKATAESPTWQQHEMMNVDASIQDRGFMPRPASPTHIIMHAEAIAQNNPALRGLPQGPLNPSVKRRHVIIDGSNVAMAFGKHNVFACRGIKLCVQFFIDRGHTEITAMVPQWRTRRVHESQLTDQNILQELQEQGYLEFTPSRRAGFKNIVPYDDRLILQTAQLTDGVVISNDNYRDLWREKLEWHDIIEHRLVQYMFVGNNFIIPEVDPVGRDGPTLEGLLTVSEHLNGPQDHPHEIRQPATGGRNQQFTMPPPPMNNFPIQPNPGWRPMFAQNERHGQFPSNNVDGRGHIFPRQQVNPDWQHNQFHAQRTVNPGKPAPQQINKPPARTLKETKQMTEQLLVVFPSESEKVNRVLQNHPAETDLNKLSSYVLAAS